MSKQQYRRKRKRKLRIRSLCITIVVLVGIIALIGFIFSILTESPYEKYQVYNEENKLYGTLTHYQEDNDNFFISIYYPQFDNEELDKIIKDTYENYIDNEEVSEEKEILFMDYSVHHIYDQFISIELNYKRVNLDNKKETTQTKIMTYDEKNNKVLKLSDCLRGQYQSLLISLGAEVNDDSDHIQVGNDSFTYYSEDYSQKFEINYEANKSLIKLANASIPSDAPLDVETPTEFKVDESKKLIAITLDDGPHQTLTQRAMTAFEKYNGRATFFQLGKNINLYPDIVKECYQRGFEIGSHTSNHSRLINMSSEAVTQDLQSVQNRVFEITGQEPTLIRPPYGERNDTVRQIFANMHLRQIIWDVDTLDWRNRDANIVSERIVKNASDGKIILLHDIHETSIAALELALPQLEEKGFQCVTVSQLYQYRDHVEYY